MNRMKKGTKMILASVTLATCAVLYAGWVSSCNKHTPVHVPSKPTEATEATTVETIKYIPPETAEATEDRAEPVRTPYELTPAERDLVERVVMAEAAGEPQIGQMLVAQCIRNACELDGVRPAEVVTHYQYSPKRPEPSDLVRASVAVIFDEGLSFTDPETMYFYAPDRVDSAWHESQEFVVEVGGHRFFKAKTEEE